MKGICFIEPLFHKVVKGEKIQTRRIIDHFGNKEHYGKLLCHWGLSRPPYLAETGEWRWELQTEVDDSKSFIIKPKYKVGETVYLKEPYVISGKYIIYKFGSAIGQECDKAGVKWNNKLFMPEWAGRYFIEITGVRAERLQDISEEDCLKEGIGYAPIQKLSWSEKLTPMWSNGFNRYSTPQKAYAALIDKINGKGTWERNPFVWAYDFKLLQKDVAPTFKPYMGRKVSNRIEFDIKGKFQSYYAAINWCKENGYSYGSTDGHNPIALWHDDSVISK